MDSLLATVVEQDAMGMTVVRTIVDLVGLPSTVAGAVGVMSISCGILIVDQEAFAASVFPDPDTVGERPVGGWMWRHRLFIPTELTF